MIDLAWLTERYFYDFGDPDVINSGWCYVWAWLAKLAHPEAQLLVYHDDSAPSAYCQHAFVQIGDLYFDSSKPTGTPHADTLQFFREDGTRIKERYLHRMSPEGFKNWWGRGAEFETQCIRAWPDELPARPNIPDPFQPEEVV